VMSDRHIEIADLDHADVTSRRANPRSAGP
jgi:hypothetical protein